jgi:ankyrin repeat protein
LSKKSAVDQLLIAAIRKDSIEDVAKAIAHGANVNLRIDKMPLLHLMVLQRRDDVVEALLAAHVDVEARDSEGRTAVMYAAWLCLGSEQLKILDRLINAGADIDAKDAHGRTAMDLAAQFSSDQAVRRLFDEGASVSQGYRRMIERVVGREGRERI